jgi:hypothetical protein
MQSQTYPTKSLLRPDQVKSAQDEIKNLEAKLQNKHIEDKGEVRRQLNRVKKDFEAQVPRPPEPGEEGKMVNRAKDLLSQIVSGMPSQEEMRKNPPGAVDKHLSWERRNKAKIAEWKHIMLRLNAGAGDASAANLEKHRPVTSTLNMDSAQIPGKQIYLPENPDGLGVTFTNDQIAVLRSLDPGLADKLGALSNAQRRQVKEIVSGIGLTAEPKAKQKRQMSEEQKAALAAGRAKAKAKREAAKAKQE